MKPKLGDYLLIAISLLVIFLGGYGVGFLSGKKKAIAITSSQAPADGPAEMGDWESRTFARLSQFLELSEDQEDQVKNEIATASQKIHTSRDEAIESYYQHLIELHDRLIPHLQPDQQEKIIKDRKDLQQVLEKRFPSS